MDPRVADALPMKVIYSVDQHIQGWRKAREFTASGPSGLTFSHFIAATYDPLLASFDWVFVASLTRIRNRCDDSEVGRISVGR
jgi:hypothetical protein